MKTTIAIIILAIIIVYLVIKNIRLSIKLKSMKKDLDYYKGEVKIFMRHD